ncbi:MULTISPECIES: FKBP-type peptidyl-prolyl cis-trans isomerase [Isoptericola]|uniref:FKBP-type peptidyl-prolyl cis-trans isomerase n=1 Tax=Isoptericola TaxID=254250 RepID=UPI0027139829|nr:MULTISPECIES: FKBP-type peptidyl-prolyl cis-trans isomerase [unclassified Isoptericola]MDO8143013.1 FKBP-type peptidyl-prolyl cis-trans isomerase [Isoptericola sp. 178]MDO8146874.1 FKBP-type peptidyl-prolyl cis-trans isomerase [Isoptericola sp. b515]MDO8150811.1 FKBP-type peptidyl-prolyl cis-trans isomerase [Isoptericola sp. b408]
MKLRTPAALGVALAAALVLGGCSDDADAPDSTEPSAPSSASADSTAQAEPTEEDIAAVESIEVTGEPGSEPELSFDDIEVSVPTHRVVDEGDGTEISEGMKLTIHYVTYDATGQKMNSTWEVDSPQSIVLGEQSDLLISPLEGQSVGTRFLLANPIADQQGEPTTAVNLIEVVDAYEIPERAEGEAVEPEEGLPTVTLGEDGAPSVEIPDGYEAPDELVAQTLIRGDGEEVSPEQTVTAHYTGWTLDGEVFDSSWERGEPSAFSLQQVIPGWTDGISGQTVGSQVLLVIPADQAYGAEAVEGNPLAGEDLVFVVDILDVE